MRIPELAHADENAAPDLIRITQLKPLYLETSVGTPESPGATIVAGAEYLDLANLLQQRIEEATGIRLPVVSDNEALNDLKTLGNIIALGQYADNSLLKHFYYRWYLVVDGMQPGKGGYVLETVHNPDNLGINLIVVGGSDRAGVEKASNRLLETVTKYGPTLPRLFEVELGEGKEIVLDYGAKALDPKRVWPTNGMNIQEAIGEAAMLYIYTGDEKYAAFFKAKLVESLEQGSFAGAQDDLFRSIISWDLVEEAPVFSDEERLWITDKLWEIVHPPHQKWDTYVFSRKNLIRPRKNHGARSAVSVYFIARYFWQYYRIPEMEQWLADVATYWEPQMSSFMAMEGTGQAIASLMPATAYALAENAEVFLAKDVLGRIADKSVMMNRGGYLYGGNYGTIWLCMAAHMFDDLDYLRPVIRKHGSMVKAYRFPSRGTRELGRSFWDGRAPEPRKPGEQTVDNWISVMPLSRLYYDAVFLHGPRNIPFEKSFDFLVFKEPEGRGRQHLELGGNNAGSYSFDTGNAIRLFYSNGYAWLGEGPFGAKTQRKLSAVSIVRNGENLPVPAFTRLDRVQSTPEWGTATTAYEDDTRTDWERNIINVPDKWFLVIDNITAREPGDYVLESRWRILGRCCFNGDDVIAAQGSHHFHLSGIGWQNQYMIPQLYRAFLGSSPHPFPRTIEQLSDSTPYQTIIARRWAGAMEKGATHVFANLFYGNASSKPLYTLRKLDANRYLVRPGTNQADRQSWLVKSDEDGQWLVERTEAVEITEPATVSRPESPAPDLKPAWQRAESARILSAAAMSVADGSRYAVGLADGRIRLIDEQGKAAAEFKMPGQVYTLCAMDIDGDNFDELLAGSDTGGVHAFRANGNRKWTWTPPPWKRPAGARESHATSRTVITGIVPIDTNGDGENEILVMGISWYILDREGNLLFFHEYNPAGRTWDGIVNEHTFVVAAGDLMGDGGDEIIGDIAGVGNAGGCSCVHVWDGKARGVRAHSPNPAKEDYLWRHSRPSNRYAGSALKAVMTGDVDGDGKDEFAIASDAYDLQLGYYDNFGSQKRPIWYCSVGSGANALLGADLDGDDKVEIIVGTEMGHVQALDGDKNRLFVTDVDESVMALAARPDGTGHEIWAGTVNGKLLVLNAQGKIIKRGHEPGLIDHLAISRDGAVLATSGGHVALYPSTDTN